MRTRPIPEPVGPDQESVWHYPRPPALEPVPERIRIVLGGETIADTTAAWRVLETSHPPNYYLPRNAFRPDALRQVEGQSWCEWKGLAHYFDVCGGDKRIARAGWGYANPTPGFAALQDHVAVYAGPMDMCLLDDEQVVPQPGAFYGGWITRRVVGPFKGEAGTEWW